MLAQTGLHGKTRRTFTAPLASGQAQTVAPTQRQRVLTVLAPARVSVGALPSLPPGAGGLDLAVVLALGSRAVGGWSMATQMRAE